MHDSFISVLFLHSHTPFCFVFQLIDPAASSVQLMGTKVEIKLKKAEALSWNVLSVPRSEPTPSTNSTADKTDTDTVIERVDAVDLSDL